MEVSGQLHAQATLSGTNWTWGWVDPIANLGVVAKGKNLYPYQESNPGQKLKIKIQRSEESGR